MSEDVIRQLITEIQSGAFQPDFWFYLFFLFIVLIGTALGGYISSYLTIKAQNLATKEDFANLLEQQRLATEATERVKAEIEETFGERKNVKALLRDRIERITQLTIDLDTWLDEAHSKALRGEPFSLANSPIPKIRVLTFLYFPDVGLEVRKLSLALSPVTNWMFEIAQEALAAQSEGRQAQFGDVLKTYDEIYPSYLEAVEGFRESLIDTYAATIGITLRMTE